MERLKECKNGGFVTPAVLTVFIILFLIIGSLSLYVSSGLKFLNAYENYYKNREEAEEILEKIIRDFQIVRYADYDSHNSMEIENLKTKYEENMLTISDCSSGINEYTFAKNFLENEKVSVLLSYKADTVLKKYGWINKNWHNQEVVKDYPPINNKNFHIQNNLPLINIYFCDYDLIDIVAEFCVIPKYDEFKLKFYDDLYNEKLEKKEIANLFGIPESSLFFTIFGFKTTFWELNFSTETNTVKAVIAAIPDEEGKIKEYRLFEKIVSDRSKK
ncbi:MAG: hypothetical protein J6Y36_06945 [Treponema sp.]|nr:hypothetical protein [Treponema sp.]